MGAILGSDDDPASVAASACRLPIPSATFNAKLGGTGGGGKAYGLEAMWLGKELVSLSVAAAIEERQDHNEVPSPGICLNLLQSLVEIGLSETNCTF